MAFTTIDPDKKLTPEEADLFVSQISGFFSTPVDVCPRCYEERDAAVPLIVEIGGPNVYFRDVVTGERLRDAPETSVALCLHCLWQGEIKR